MKVLLLFAMLLIASATLVSCRQKTKDNIAPEALRATKLTEKELAKLIHSGMSTSDLVNRFGQPNSIEKTDTNITLYSYSFPLDTKNRDLHLAGFDVYIKDGVVTEWFPIMEESRQVIQAGNGKNVSKKLAFNIFLATEIHSNIVNAINMHGSADITNMNATADLTFQAEVFSGTSGNERPGEKTVILLLSDQDSSRLKELTENNMGRRLLIACRNKIIAAPVFSAPLSSRQLLFTVKDPSVLSGLQQ